MRTLRLLATASRRHVSSGSSAQRYLLRLTDVIDLGGKIQAPQCHAEQEPQPGHDAVAIADAHAGLGQVQLEPADILRPRRIGRAIGRRRRRDPATSMRWPASGASTSATGGATGRGRRRADAATVIFPAYRDERACCRTGREDQRPDGRRLSHLLRQFRLRGERGRLQDRPAVHEAGTPRGISLQDHRPLLRLSRHDARHPGCRRHGRTQSEVRAIFRQLCACRAALLLSLPIRPQLSELRARLR